MTEATEVEERYSYPLVRSPECPFQPPPLYAKLREEEPIKKLTLDTGREAWLFTRYDDIRAVLSHPDISGDTSHPEHPMNVRMAGRGIGMERSFLHMDDPEHARRRRMFAPFFTVRRIEEMRPLVRRRVGELIDQLLRDGPPADFFQRFALALPSSVACELLGVPYDDHEFFETRFAITTNRESTQEEQSRANSELRDYLDQLIASKYDHPTNDLLGTLVTDFVKTGQLSHASAVGETYILLLAGHETTSNTIALGTLIMLEHPDQLAKLREDKSLLDGAVEEILRYANVTQNAGVRYAAADLEIAGTKIKAGDAILAPVSAANRDASAFPEPERFDITRKARHHLVFSFGIHQCLGQPLARVELQEVFSTLFDRLPNLALAVPFEEIPFKYTSTFYGVHELPLTW